MINWRSLPYLRDKELVVGTYLSVGFLEGFSHRFGIYERRTRIWDEKDKRYYPSVSYDVRDAHKASDIDVQAGKLPPVVFQSDDPAACEHWIKANSSN